MIKKILLLYKESAFRTYFKNDEPLKTHPHIQPRVIERFKASHVNHYETLKNVERILKERKIFFQKKKRGTKVNYAQYELTITVGGDGTFLEAARNIGGEQIILGVNSDVKWSVGRFCGATATSFSRIMDNILHHRHTIQSITRLRLYLKLHNFTADAINDILLCHKNPAAMSRYYILLNNRKEEQKSSGIWVSTAAGSSGALHSAGGKILPLTSEKLQYKPREIYYMFGKKPALTGSTLTSKQKIKFISLMRDGVIYIDGAHVKVPFVLGEEASVIQSPVPLRMVTG